MTRVSEAPLFKIFKRRLGLVVDADSVLDLRHIPVPKYEPDVSASNHDANSFVGMEINHEILCHGTRRLSFLKAWRCAKDYAVTYKCKTMIVYLKKRTDDQLADHRITYDGLYTGVGASYLKKVLDMGLINKLRVVQSKIPAVISYDEIQELRFLIDRLEAAYWARYPASHTLVVIFPREMESSFEKEIEAYEKSQAEEAERNRIEDMRGEQWVDPMGCGQYLPADEWSHILGEYDIPWDDCDSGGGDESIVAYTDPSIGPYDNYRDGSRSYYSEDDRYRGGCFYSGGSFETDFSEFFEDPF